VTANPSLPEEIFRHMAGQGHASGYPGSFTFSYYLPKEDTYLTYNLNSVGTSMHGMFDIRSSILMYLKNASVAQPI
jgi:hypothetical protein